MLKRLIGSILTFGSVALSMYLFKLGIHLTAIPNEDYTFLILLDYVAAIAVLIGSNNIIHKKFYVNRIDG